ncbi:hypothetical protein PMAYCL1PPCAC_14835, partial [Pristionchus mayeri]
VLTGGNRGIGLGLVKELLKNDPVGKVFATTRNPSKSLDLNSITDPRHVVVEMDTESEVDQQSCRTGEQRCRFFGHRSPHQQCWRLPSH